MKTGRKFYKLSHKSWFNNRKKMEMEKKTMAAFMAVLCFQKATV